MLSVRGIGVLAAILALSGTAQAASLTLTWVNTSTVATNVRIERCLGAGCTSFAEIGVVAGNVTTFVDSTLGENQTANYRVRASVGTPATDFSGYSNVAGNKTRLNDPTGLTVTVP